MVTPSSSLHVDTAQSFKFLHMIDSHAAVFTFQILPEKCNGSSPVAQQVLHSKSVTELQTEHDKGAAIFVVVNETDGNGRKKENIKRIRCVFQEDDDGYAGAFPLAPSIVVESSPAHFHRYWLIADHWPADEKGRADFASVMERMVVTYGSDKYAKDISRVLRLPGFWHRKSAPFMVRIIEANDQRYTRGEIMAAFPPVVRAPIKAREWKPCGNPSSDAAGTGSLRS